MNEDLEAYVEITKPDGTRYRLDGDGFAEDVPTGLQWSSKRMEGHASASWTLPRRIDQDHPDIELRDEVRILSASGESLWEGRVSAAPRSMDDGHSIDVQATGWMASARDRKFRQIFVDRRFDSWGEPSLAFKAATAAAGYGQGKIPSSSEGGLSWTPPNEAMPIAETSTLVYDAGDGLTVSKIQYRGARTGAFTSFEAPTLFSDSASDFPSATSYALTLDNTTREQVLTTAEQYILLRARTTAGVTPGVGYLQKYDQIAVYGDHGLTTRDITGEPDGVYASDVMEYVIQAFCPKLTWAGNDSTYPIPQLAFRELTDPYDALLACNAFHLLDLACWENKTVHWYPVDLTDWDWEIRLDDPGVKITLEGDSDEDLANGIVVEYTDLQTGETKFLYPDDHDELRDDSELNPANRHGDEAWTEAKLTNPTSEDGALQIGRMMLAEHNQPKSPGQYNIQGYLRDRQGNWQPGWKVRATDRIVIADHPNRRPRLITEASWNQDSHTLTVATDSAIQRVDAFIDRTTTALAAANLT